MTLLIEDRQSTVTDDLQAFFESIILTALDHLGIDDPVEISLLLTDDQQIKDLNMVHRGLSETTDVLSFPQAQPDEGDGFVDSLGGDKNKDSGDVVLGDIVISTEKAFAQAQEYGHSLKRELGFLIVHGLLHLLGYDHEIDKENEHLMFSLQEDILNKLELPRTNRAN
ncbi:MAG TPA: rRNA maturation RNase YbeY [Bacillota bacterium]|nr:rRNA maturation RNase YbeY [Bacillota bacterium]